MVDLSEVTGMDQMRASILRKRAKAQEKLDAAIEKAQAKILPLQELIEGFDKILEAMGPVPQAADAPQVHVAGSPLIYNPADTAMDDENALIVRKSPGFYQQTMGRGSQQPPPHGVNGFPSQNASSVQCGTYQCPESGETKTPDEMSEQEKLTWLRIA